MDTDAGAAAGGAPRVVAALGRVPAAVGTGVAALGALVFLGWVLGYQPLTSFRPALATMKANTSLAFVALGIALRKSRSPTENARRWKDALSALAATLGLLTLFEHAFGVELGVDQLLVRDHWSVASPGRMSPVTATLFVLLGGALLVSERGLRQAVRTTEWLALGAGFSALLALLGYAYGVPSLYEVGPYNAIALHTALYFAALAVGVLCIHPEAGFMAIVGGGGPGGMLARRVLPAIVLVPVALGWLRATGQKLGFYGTGFGIALLVLSNVVCLGLLVFATARAIEKGHGREEQARAKLRESEEDLAITIQSIGDAVIATDREGRVTRMNPAAERLTGYSFEAAQQRPLDEVFRIVDEDTRRPIESPVARVLRDGAVVGLANHTLLLSQDGTERAIADSGAPIRDPSGALRGVVLVFHDQTADRQAERALRRSELRFRRLTEAGVIGIVVSDAEGNITEANDRFLAIVGYSREELAAGLVNGKTLNTPDRERTDANARRELAETGIARPWEKELLHKNGARIPVLNGVVALDEECRECVAFVLDRSELERAEAARQRAVAAARDETRERERAELALQQTEEQLRHSQKMEAVGTLAGGVAHDFNNILSIILGFSELLLDDLEPSHPMHGDLEQIAQAGRRASDLTRQLLAFSRRQVLQPKLVNLNDAIAGMTKMLHRVIGEDIELVFLPADAVSLTLVDPGQMEQVVLNVVVNARDAMPRGGKLTIETANVVLDPAYCAEHVDVEPGPYVVVSVSDTGAGMDRATLARIFEPFFTTKEQGKGTGLGLSTAHGIIRQSGGHIWVYSEPGKGSTFKIYVPRAPNGQEETARTRVPSRTLRGSETILLVEDDEQVRTLAVAVLKRNGYDVLAAASGAEALLVCRQQPRPIHLVLTDVVMPKMSGRELWEQVRGLVPGIKVLFMSGYTDDAIVRHGFLDSEFDFVQKPLGPTALLSKVRATLDGTSNGGRKPTDIDRE